MDPEPQDAINRKATIVIEHLIQASDVAHTMQHWHIYTKWNERLFLEMDRAYRQGRINNDPSANWYKGELGFFDFYILPLCKKLKSCGVFGVSSDEYLNYAEKNRKVSIELAGSLLADGTKSTPWLTQRVFFMLLSRNGRPREKIWFESIVN